MEERKTWPLFWCLKPEAQALIMRFQRDAHGQTLEIPAPPETANSAWHIVLSENLEEIDRLMRQPPKHQKRVK